MFPEEITRWRSSLPPMLTPRCCATQAAAPCWFSYHRVSPLCRVQCGSPQSKSSILAPDFFGTWKGGHQSTRKQCICIGLPHTFPPPSHRRSVVSPAIDDPNYCSLVTMLSPPSDSSGALLPQATWRSWEAGSPCGRTRQCGKGSSPVSVFSNYSILCDDGPFYTNVWNREIDINGTPVVQPDTTGFLKTNEHRRLFPFHFSIWFFLKFAVRLCPSEYIKQWG